MLYEIILEIAGPEIKCTLEVGIYLYSRAMIASKLLWFSVKSSSVRVETTLSQL